MIFRFFFVFGHKCSHRCRSVGSGPDAAWREQMVPDNVSSDDLDRRESWHWVEKKNVPMSHVTTGTMRLFQQNRLVAGVVDQPGVGKQEVTPTQGHTNTYLFTSDGKMKKELNTKLSGSEMKCAKIFRYLNGVNFIV